MKKYVIAYFVIGFIIACLMLYLSKNGVDVDIHTHGEALACITVCIIIWPLVIIVGIPYFIYIN
jgi:hypothetical protein